MLQATRNTKNAGTSILLVSHSAAQINRHCDRAIWIDRGGVVAEGYAKRVVNAYQMYNGEDWKKNKKDISEIVEGRETRERIKNEINKEAKNEQSIIDTKYTKPGSRISYKKQGGSIEEISIRDNKECIQNTFDEGETIYIDVRAKVDNNCKIRLCCFITDKEGATIGGRCYPSCDAEGLEVKKGETIEKRFKIRGAMWPGLYFIGAGLSNTEEKGVFLHRVIDDQSIKIRNTMFEVKVGDTKIIDI